MFFVVCSEFVVSFCEGTFPEKGNQFAQKKRQCVVGKSSAQELFFSGNEEKPKKQSNVIGLSWAPGTRGALTSATAGYSQLPPHPRPPLLKMLQT